MFECDKCNKEFNRNGNLKRHIKAIHDKIKDFECDKCNKSFSQNGHLQQHIKLIHDKIKDIHCNLCEYSCSANGTLQQHIKLVHDKIKDHKCNLCEYSCSANGALQYHIKAVHDKIKDFECDKCNYKCSSNSNLQQHIQMCTGQNARFSGGEYKVVEALQDLGFIENVDYYFNTTFSKLTDYTGKQLRPDFRFIKHNIIIEYDGIQHFKPRSFGGTREKAEENFKQIQENDRLKDEFCVNNDYKMIRINYKQFPDILTILSTELHNIINWIG